jgi:hypothetical protein
VCSIHRGQLTIVLLECSSFRDACVLLRSPNDELSEKHILQDQAVVDNGTQFYYMSRWLLVSSIMSHHLCTGGEFVFPPHACHVELKSHITTTAIIHHNEPDLAGDRTNTLCQSRDISHQYNHAREIRRRRRRARISSSVTVSRAPRHGGVIIAT